MRETLILLLAYLGIGVSTNLFLFHLPVLMRRLDTGQERLRIARTVPPMARLSERGDEDLAKRAVGLGIVLMWPLFVVPLIRWMGELQ
jgi:hypothetical protein